MNFNIEMTHWSFVNVNGGGVPRLMRELRCEELRCNYIASFCPHPKSSAERTQDETGRVDPYISVCLPRRSDVRITVSSSWTLKSCRPPF